MAFLADIFDIIDILLDGFLPFISSIFSVLITPISELTDTISDLLPSFSGISLVSSLVSNILSILGLEELTLFGFMFGAGVLAFVLITFVNWVKELIPFV